MTSVEFIAKTNNHMEEIQNKIIEALNEADEKLTATEFSQLAQSIIDYIDEIARSK